MITLVDSTKTTGLIFFPGTMVGMLLAGASPTDAVRLQLILLYALLGSVAIAALVATGLAYRNFFTPAQQLREPTLAAPASTREAPLRRDVETFHRPPSLPIGGPLVGRGQHEEAPPVGPAELAEAPGTVKRSGASPGRDEDLAAGDMLLPVRDQAATAALRGEVAVDSRAGAWRHGASPGAGRPCSRPTRPPQRFWRGFGSALAVVPFDAGDRDVGHRGELGAGSMSRIRSWPPRSRRPDAAVDPGGRGRGVLASASRGSRAGRRRPGPVADDHRSTTPAR